MAKRNAAPRTPPPASKIQHNNRAPSTPANPPRINFDSDSEMTPTSQLSEMNTPSDWTPTNRSVEASPRATGNGAPRGRGRGGSRSSFSTDSHSNQIERRGRGRPKKVREEVVTPDAPVEAPRRSMENPIDIMRAKQAKKKAKMQMDIEQIKEVVLQGEGKQVVEKRKDDIAIGAAFECPTERDASHAIVSLRLIVAQQHRLRRNHNDEPMVIAEEGEYIPVVQEREESPELLILASNGQHDVNKLPASGHEDNDSTDIPQLPELDFDEQYIVKKLPVYTVTPSMPLTKVPIPKIDTICKQLPVDLSKDDVLTAIQLNLYKHAVDVPQLPLKPKGPEVEEDNYYYDIAGVADDVSITGLLQMIGANHDKDKSILEPSDGYHVLVQKKPIPKDVDIFEEAEKQAEMAKRNNLERGEQSVNGKATKHTTPAKNDKSDKIKKTTTPLKTNQPAENDETEKEWFSDFDPMDFSSHFPTCVCLKCCQKQSTGIRPSLSGGLGSVDWDQEFRAIDNDEADDNGTSSLVHGYKPTMAGDGGNRKRGKAKKQPEGKKK